jgi:hypothetical protein
MPPQLAHIDCVSPTKYYSGLLVMLGGPLAIGVAILLSHALISRLPREGMHGREDCGRRTARLRCVECARLGAATRLGAIMCGTHAAATRGCRECVPVVACAGALPSDPTAGAASCPVCGAELVCGKHGGRGRGRDGSVADCGECVARRAAHESLRAASAAQRGTAAASAGAALLCAEHAAAALACPGCTLRRALCSRHGDAADGCSACTDTRTCAAHGAAAAGCTSCRHVCWKPRVASCCGSDFSRTRKCI